IRLQRQQGLKPAGAFYMRLTSNLRALEGEVNNQATFKLTQTGDGKGIMFVAHNGEVYPSGFLPMLTGKVPEESLTSIYKSNPLFVALRDPSRLKGRCGR